MRRIDTAGAMDIRAGRFWIDIQHVHAKISVNRERKEKRVVLEVGTMAGDESTNDLFPVELAILEALSEEAKALYADEAGNAKWTKKFKECLRKLAEGNNRRYRV